MEKVSYTRVKIKWLKKEKKKEINKFNNKKRTSES